MNDRSDLRAGILKRIHVNQHIIKANKELPIELQSAPLTVKTSANNHKAYRVAIDGPCELIYSPDKPLDCGARVWIETLAQVDLKGCAQ